MRKTLIILTVLALVFPTTILAVEVEQAVNCSDYCRYLNNEEFDKTLPTVIGETSCDCAIDCDDYCNHLKDVPPKYQPPGQICFCNPLPATTTEYIIDNIINSIFNVAIVLVPLMIVIAGFLFVTAGGNLEQTKRAKDIIVWTIVGFFIVLLAKGVMGMIQSLLGVS